MRARDLISVGFALAVYEEDGSDDDVIASKQTIVVSETQLLSGRIEGITNNSTLTSLNIALQRQ